MMIPKIIHYCWLSNDPIPDTLKKCMESWKNKLPDYTWIHWDFNRFDKESSLWVKQAYDNRKYAFAADYIRLYALYNYGGIYLDMDVEVIKSFDNFLDLPTMICFENSDDKRLEVAAFGVEKGSEWVGDCLMYYKNRAFIKQDGSFDTKVLPCIIRDILNREEYNLIPVNSIDESKRIRGNKNIPVFPFYFFSPKSYGTGKVEKNQDTYSIHHFAGTWLPWYSRLEKYIFNSLGLKFRDGIRNIIKRIHK